MTIEQEAADLLERAADGFESGRYYWTRGRYSRMVFGTQAYCSLGALAHESGLTRKQISEEVFDQPVLSAATSALALEVANNDFYPAGSIVSWNDRFYWEKDKPVPMGKGPVIEAMKHAAKELRNKEGDTV